MILPSPPVTTDTGDLGSVGVPGVTLNPLPTVLRLSAPIAWPVHFRLPSGQLENVSEPLVYLTTILTKLMARIG